LRKYAIFCKIADLFNDILQNKYALLLYLICCMGACPIVLHMPDRFNKETGRWSKRGECFFTTADESVPGRGDGKALPDRSGTGVSFGMFYITIISYYSQYL
jgi:hypothetical protein